MGAIVVKHEAYRISQLKPPWSVAQTKELLAVQNTGKDIYWLNDGELDLPVPQAIIDATHEALANGKTRYDDVKGLLKLRERICAKLWQCDGIAADPDEILITNGSSQAIFEIFQCYVSPGDMVLVPVPGWPTYEQSIRIAGGIPVGYSCLDPELDIDYLRCMAVQGARLLIINSPHNPTGIVLSRCTIENLIELAAEFDMLILADEAYDTLLHDRVERVTTKSVSGVEHPRILTTRSFSKCYSMTGYRIGYLHAQREVINRCATLHAHISDNVCTFAQFGAAAALVLPHQLITNRAAVVQKRLETAYTLISPILPCPRPRGGFYLFPSLMPLHKQQSSDAQEFIVHLFQQTGVACVPGDAFGCPGHFRISIAAVDCERISQSIPKIIDFIQKHG